MDFFITEAPHRSFLKLLADKLHIFVFLLERVYLSMKEAVYWVGWAVAGDVRG